MPVMKFKPVMRVKYQNHQQSKRQKTDSKLQRMVLRKYRMMLRRNGTKQYYPGLLHNTPLLA